MVNGPGVAFGWTEAPLNPPRALALLALSSLAVGCASAGASPQQTPSAPVSAASPRATAEPGDDDRVIVSAQAIEDLQSAYKSAIAAAGPAVVSVYSTKVVGERGVLGGLFGGPGGLRRGLGSGFILDSEGFILTNNHVVEDADEIRVELADGREFDAEVIGTDPPTDLALVRIEGKDLTAVEVGNSDVVEVGDFVLAIGNPFGLPQTVSSGIVSAKGRANVGIVDYENFIQTDAPINPGNSGGPLIDLRGRVIGINTAIASRSGGNNGIAFAIPVNMAMDIAGKLRDQGRVARGQLGVVISDLDAKAAERMGWRGPGVLIQDAPAGGPAHEAGLQGGDIITRLNGGAVSDMPAFRSDIAATPPGSKVWLRIWREGIERDFEITLGELAPRPRR
jgi:serine protease Do